MPQEKLLIITTVPETLATILRNQPKFLANSLSTLFSIELVTSPADLCEDVGKSEGLYIHKVRMARGIAFISDLMSVARMTQLMWRIKPRVVHSYTAKAGLVSMLAAWACRVPIRIHTFTGLVFPTEKGIKKWILMWVDRLICACANIIIPEGNGVKNDLLNHHITSKPLNIIGHGNIAGVDTTYFDPNSEEVIFRAKSLSNILKIKNTDFIFCFIGRLNKDKGIAELLVAFKALPKHAKLIIVGELDSTSPISQAELSEIKHNPNIHALGFQKDIRPALKLANTFILPSYREGFPNSLLQACAMEKPAIATDINGSNEIVEPGKNGWLVPPRSSDMLFRAMRMAMNTPSEQRAALGAYSRSKIQNQFEQKKHWENMVIFYSNLIHN